MKIYKHQCSCGQKYEDNDPNIYLCPACIEKRKEIAKEVDAKMANRPKKQVKSLFTEKDFVGNRGRKFFSAKELGL